MPESTNPGAGVGIRDRIRELRRVRARDLLPHPANWRRHPEAQQRALRAMLEEIGYAGALLVRETEGGQLQIIDGHLRAETTPDLEVPVLVLDVTEAEAEKLLLTLDPLAALATRDDAAMRALLERVGTASTEVRAFLDGLAAQLPPLSGEKSDFVPHSLPEGFADIRQGHVLDVLRAMEPESVHCVVTSPPYWGLRDYGLPPIVWDGDPACAHEWGEELTKVVAISDKREEIHHTERDALMEGQAVSQGAFCQKCGAWRGALGLEPTPDLYVSHLVEVFRAVRRVLRPDGTVWLNLGDSYVAGASGGSSSGGTYGDVVGGHGLSRRGMTFGALKPKDMLGMPWRVAFALQADGWYLRSDIIWSKPNPMPESVADRPTKAHEYLFLLAQSERYYYDADAIREPQETEPAGMINRFPAPNKGELRGLTRAGNRTADGWIPNGYNNPLGRNKRTVWEIATQPYPEAHFATFPEALVEPCILAGCPEGGCVLDPFAGSGTTLLVAKRLGRSALGIELSPDYCALITRRLAELVPEES